MTQQLSILAAYAHPDDEQGVSGLLAQSTRRGIVTTLVCATRGEVGEIAPGVNATPDTLGVVREGELRCAAAKIGVQNLYLLDYRDSGMAGTPENNDNRSLHQASVFEVAGDLVRIIRKHRPQVLITFDPYGGYGHPDHIKIHQATLVAYFVAGDARSYPEQLENGLEPWAPQKLYYTAITKNRFDAYERWMMENKIQAQDWMKDFMKRALPDELVSARIDVSQFIDLKWDSLQCHASQMSPNSPFAKIPPNIRKEATRFETFMLAESRLGRANGIEDDLFAGVDGKSN